MGSPSTVVSMGYGSFGSVGLVVTLGFGSATLAPITTISRGWTAHRSRLDYEAQESRLDYTAKKSRLDYEGRK